MRPGWYPVNPVWASAATPLLRPGRVGHNISYFIQIVFKHVCLRGISKLSVTCPTWCSIVWRGLFPPRFATTCSPGNARTPFKYMPVSSSCSNLVQVNRWTLLSPTTLIAKATCLPFCCFLAQLVQHVSRKSKSYFECWCFFRVNHKASWNSPPSIPSLVHVLPGHFLLSFRQCSQQLRFWTYKKIFLGYFFNIFYFTLYVFHFSLVFLYFDVNSQKLFVYSQFAWLFLYSVRFISTQFH